MTRSYALLLALLSGCGLLSSSGDVASMPTSPTPVPELARPRDTGSFAPEDLGGVDVAVGAAGVTQADAQ